jgi:hypothetical protein
MTTPFPTSAQDYIRIHGLAGLCINSGGLHVAHNSKRPGRDPARNDPRLVVSRGRGAAARAGGRERIDDRGRGGEVWDRTISARTDSVSRPNSGAGAGTAALIPHIVVKIVAGAAVGLTLLVAAWWIATVVAHIVG